MVSAKEAVEDALVNFSVRRGNSPLILVMSVSVSTWLSHISSVFYGFLTFISNFFDNIYNSSNKFALTIIYISIGLTLLAVIYNFVIFLLTRGRTFTINNPKERNYTYKTQKDNNNNTKKP